MKWGHYLFGFGGRINRAKYWLWVLLYIIAAIVIGGIVYVVNSDAASAIVQIVFGIAAFISSLAVTTKRLHDRSKSAWWLVIFYFVPSILLGIGVGLTAYGAMSTGGTELGNMGLIGGILILAGAAFTLWAFVELGCLRGTIGANQYGPDPLEGRV